MSFGLLKTTAAVAFFAGDFGTGTVILKSGFDWVERIVVLGTWLECLPGQGQERVALCRVAREARWTG